MIPERHWKKINDDSRRYQAFDKRELYSAGTGRCQTDVQNNIHGSWYNEGINKASTF